MTNNMKKILIAGLACVALAGTTFAAPCGGHGCGCAPAHERHHAPPAPKQHHHDRHHEGERNGWAMLGAAAVGGIVGGLINACR